MNETKPDFWESLSPGKAAALTVLVPSLYFVALVVAWFAPKHFGFGLRPLVYVGLTVGLSGVALWMVAMAHLGKSLAVLPGGERLVTHGVYRYLRHPVYVGIDMTLFGLFLAVGSTYGMIYFCLVVVPLNIIRSRFEEKALMQKFGDDYNTYRQKTWF
ncbi:MAG: isoprenylcysteine carboxylmethyltransferase family protein [Nitrospinota bacterium]|nr:isoprenylcysteine carboxylmethyltransferase family protein [Nitrospinota bacterium]